MASTSRLDQIYKGVYNAGDPDKAYDGVAPLFQERFEEQIKLLFLEVIGPDEPKPTDCCDNEGGVICLTESKVKARNKLKAKQRQLVEAL